jgi:exonuclease III
VANLAALGLISDAILVQEAHLNHLDKSAFNSILPGWEAHFSSKSNGFAGVVTLISPALSKQYTAAVQPVDPGVQGHVLALLLSPIAIGAPDVLILNLYLATGKRQAARLTDQLSAATAIKPAAYNFMGGDLNFVENPDDTTNAPHNLPAHSLSA